MVLRWLRRIFIWVGPIVVLLLAVSCGFLFWALGTQAGTRWALVTAAGQLDGQVSGIRGTIWRGVSVGEFSMAMPGVSIELNGLHLQANWRELLDARLHVNDLSADSVRVSIEDQESGEEEEPFEMPALPVRVALDRLAVGRLWMEHNGEALPVDVRNLSTAVYLHEAGGQLVLQSLNVEHEQARAAFSGELALASLRDPWPLELRLSTQASGTTADSPLCARNYLATLPAARPASARREPAQPDSRKRAPGEKEAQGKNQQAATERKSAAEQKGALEPKNANGQKDVRESKGGAVAAGKLDSAVDEPLAQPCTLDMETRVSGDLNALRVTVRGDGQGMSVDADANLTPRGSLPLKDMVAALHLADGSSLDAKLEWKMGGGAGHPAAGDPGAGHPAAGAPAPGDTAAADSATGPTRDRLTGTLRTERLNLGQLVGPSIPDAVLSMASEFDVLLEDRSRLRSAQLAVEFAEGSRWNKQALAGRLKAHVVDGSLSASTAASVSITTDAAAKSDAKAGAKAQAKADTKSDTRTDAKSDAKAETSAGADTVKLVEPSGAAAGSTETEAAQEKERAFVWQTLQLLALDMDLRLGRNHLQAQGSLGAADSGLKLDLAAPDLAAFWPGLPGGAQLQGDVAGTLASHKADLKAVYMQGDGKSTDIGTAPVRAHVVLDGGWGRGGEADSLEGWRGTIKSLDADHAGLGIATGTPMSASFIPGAAAPAWQWQLGAGQLDLVLDSNKILTLNHGMSRGGGGRWETQGAIRALTVSPKLVSNLRKKLDPAYKEEADRGGVKLKADRGADTAEIVLALDWNLRFAGALEGQARIKRVSGDVMVPAEPAFPLGLQALRVDISAKRAGDTTSRITADLRAATAKMGSLSASASTLLHATPGGGLALDPKDVKTVKLDADIEDLGWTSLFLDDSMELGGAVQAKIQLQSRPDGSWDSSGAIAGQKIRVLRIDDGVRLLDGTLAARLDGERIILDQLSFPALLRVTPKEWRTAEWVSTNPDAKGGSLTLRGDWNLFESRGVIDVVLKRYPILQRSDRYAMVTGQLRLAAELPKIDITGSITADAGWFDLDMLGGIPTVDSDVVVLRPGEKRKEVSAPMDVSMDLQVDLGPRFYLTGYGVNSGLVGNLRITMVDGRLTGMGALRTRGGAIEAYGQRLQLRRGTITFQGDIASPVLDIEALRTGLAVEAGVRVAGTAKRPRIDLVSYPAVSEIEKLSWLLLGHGPNDSGGDVALLFSVGTSFLGDGEPFYRKFGIDEVSMRSGDLGSVGSILPAESVVSGLDSGTSDIERRFVTASKALSKGFTVSIQQALAETGTVGRISYRLARGLTAELSAGTVNGLALIYRWFSRE